MLGLRLQTALIVICVCAFIYLFYKMKKKKVDVKYSLPWLFLDAVMLIMAIFPRILVGLRNLLGIQTVSNAVFFAALLFLLAIVYVMSRTISRPNNEIRELAQRVALDEVEKNNTGDE